MRRVKGILGSVTTLSLLVLGLVGPTNVFAATSPTLVGSSSYSVLGATTVTCTGATTITGDVGVSPGTSITGFPSPCTVSPGTTHSNDASAIAAQSDNLTAFGALDQTCDHTYGAQDLTLLSPLGPGVYCSTSTFSLSGNLALTGAGPWIFKTVSGLNTSPGSSVTGGDACNVWWRVGSSAVLDTTTNFEGNILALTDINLKTGALLNGRAMVQTGQVTLDTNTISGPTCASIVPPSSGGNSSSYTGTITVVKTVVNDNGGTKKVADFPLFINGAPVVSGVTNTFSFNSSGPYNVSETVDPHYAASFSGDCNASGVVYLHPSENKFCIMTNNDIGAPPVVPPVPPLIDVVKVPSPLALPNGPGSVTYTYTVRNIGTVPMSDVTLVDNSCPPTFVSGDTNGDSKLEVNETWKYTCSKILPATHMNTVVATGWANGISAVALASATVVVGAPVIPPIIHVTKIPNPLALLAAGGLVTYTEKVTNPGSVALSNVTLNDDKCSPMKRVSGDANNDGKLDVGETWTYTCQSRLTKTTTNTATATGQANGLTARDLAIATVVVAAAVPPLPKTGVAPVESMSVSALIALGLCAIGLTLYAAKKKRVL